MNNCSCSLVSDCAWVFFLFCFFYSSTICTRVPARVAAVATRALKMVKSPRASKVISAPLGPLRHSISNFNHPLPDQQSPDVTSRRVFIALLILGCDHLRLAPFTLFHFICCTVTGPVKNNASFSLTQTSFSSHAHAP